MIVYLNQSITTLALRIKENGDRSQLLDWRSLQLIISPPHPKYDPCYMGSPWFLWGCWPGKRVGVDVANQHVPDFPSICINAQETDADGRVVFPVGEHVRCLPVGRYLGAVQSAPQSSRVPHLPYNMIVNLGRNVYPKGKIIPPEYQREACSIDMPPPPCIPEPVCSCCILAEFDIDIGPACHEHIIDQAAVDYAITYCGE